MPSGARSGYRAIIVGGGSLLVLIALWAMWSFYSDYKQEKTNNRENAAAQYSEKTDDAVLVKCVDIAGQFDRLACVAQEARTQQREAYSYYELEAQQEMAVWTFALLLVSISGTVIAFFGVLYVAGTLRVTREMSQRQMRAYVGIGTIRLHMSAGGIVGTIVRVENTGQTPAKNLTSRVTISARLSSSDDPLPAPEKEPAVRSRAVLPSGRTVTIQNVVIPFPISPEDQRAIADGRVTIFVHGLFTYDDIFDDEHRTKFCLYFTGAGGGERKMDVYHTGNEAD